MTRLGVLSALVLPSVAGCVAGASEDGVVGGHVALAAGSSPLGVTSTPIDSIDGTYGAGCTDRHGAWSMRVGASAGTLTNPTLSVVTADGADCVLTVTAATLDGVTYPATPSFALAGTFAAAPATFGTGGAAVWANFRIMPSDFSADFTIDVYLSAPPHGATASVTATH